MRQDPLLAASSSATNSNNSNDTIGNKLIVPENFINGQWVQRPTFFD